MDSEKEVLLTEKINVDTVTQTRELLASTSLPPEEHIPENMGQSPGYSPWHSQACWCYGSTAFRGWGEPESTTIKGKEAATMATT